MEKLKLLGISGTPVKGGNCDKLVQLALKAAEELGDVETEFITLADKKIAMCKHCQWCIENRKPCKIKDDFHLVFDSMEKADGLILGGPTWGMTLAPPLSILLSRGRYYTFMTTRFRNKVVGALTLGFFGFGMDHALSVIVIGAIVRRMIPVASATALVSTVAIGKRPAYLEHGVLDDTAGVSRAKDVAIRVVEVARMVKYATDAGIGVPDSYRRSVTGGSFGASRDKVLVDGAWRDK